MTPAACFMNPLGIHGDFFKAFCLDRISLVFSAVDFPREGNEEPVEFLSLKHMDVPFVFFFPILTCDKKANFKKPKDQGFTK